MDYQLTPGEPFPKEQGFKTSTTSATPESTTSTTPDATGGSSYQPDDGNGLSGGAVAGIAIGGAAVLILATGMIYLCSRRGGVDEAYRKTLGNNAMPIYPNEAPPVVEAEVGSPNGTVPGFWVYKPMSPIASCSGQSPRTSPPPRPPKEELVSSAELPGQKLAEPVAELPESANSGS